MTRSVPTRDRRRDGMGAIDSVTRMNLLGTMFSHALTADADGQNGTTFVMWFAAAALTLPDDVISQVRITFEAGAAQGLTITNAYIGHAAGSGDAYDFAATPTQILFGGVASAAIGAGLTQESDWISFVYDKTNPLLIAFYLGGGVLVDTIRYATGLANVNQYSKVANEAALVNKTGYSISAGALVSVNEIETDGF